MKIHEWRLGSGHGLVLFVDDETVMPETVQPMKEISPQDWEGLRFELEFTGTTSSATYVRRGNETLFVVGDNNYRLGIPDALLRNNEMMAYLTTLLNFAFRK